MSPEEDGVLAPVIAVVGPSGVGKDSLMAALCQARPGFQMVRRVITRPASAGGEDFDAATEAEFSQMAQNGAFVLSWQAHGLSYGIPKAIAAQRQEASAVLVNLSRSVLGQAQDLFGNLIVLSMSVSREVLAQRLRARGRESETDQNTRLDRATLSLPEGLHTVIPLDNSGPLDGTVQAVLASLPPDRG